MVFNGSASYTEFFQRKGHCWNEENVDGDSTVAIYRKIGSKTTPYFNYHIFLIKRFYIHQFFHFPSLLFIEFHSISSSECFIGIRLYLRVFLEVYPVSFCLSFSETLCSSCHLNDRSRICCWIEKNPYLNSRCVKTFPRGSDDTKSKVLFSTRHFIQNSCLITISVD